MCEPVANELLGSDINAQYKLLTNNVAPSLFTCIILEGCVMIIFANSIGH